MASFPRENVTSLLVGSWRYQVDPIVIFLAEKPCDLSADQQTEHALGEQEDF